MITISKQRMYRNHATIFFYLLFFVGITANQGWSHQNSKTEEESPNFVYDHADHTVPSTLLENPLLYDADILIHNQSTWLAWLEFTPGKGDQIWVGQRQGDNWQSKHLSTPNHGEYANPTLTVDSNNKIWLSYEWLNKNHWDICVLPLENGQPTAAPLTVSPNKSTDIHHVVAADGNGNLWFVWQTDNQGQFDVVARQFTAGKFREVQNVGKHPAGDWHPQLRVDPNNNVHIVWDAYQNDSFNVYLKSLRNGQWSQTQTIADSPAFEGRPQIAADPTSHLWIAWEEGGENWGKPFRGINTETLRDHHGPLHRFRELKLAVVDPSGNINTLAESLPMPSLDQAANREGRHEGIHRTGAFYERAALTVDGSGRPWIAYRHNYTPWLSIGHRTHVEQGWGVYARYYGNQGWSPLYKTQIGQGDGLQRLELQPTQSGITAVWTTGRTHRDRNQRPRGIVTASIEAPGTSSNDLRLSTRKETQASKSTQARATSREHTSVRNKQFHLFYGDLHRHTDLSLCRVPIDGTIDDAYRYAIEVARLDFLGITDHSRDIAQGDPLSQLWWRSRKEVERHRLGTTFIPFFSYERSHSNTADHNVISLRGDMLRPHTYPLPDFWNELDPRYDHHRPPTHSPRHLELSRRHLPPVGRNLPRLSRHLDRRRRSPRPRSRLSLWFHCQQRPHVDQPPVTPAFGQNNLTVNPSFAPCKPDVLLEQLTKSLSKLLPATIGWAKSSTQKNFPL